MIFTQFTEIYNPIHNPIFMARLFIIAKRVRKSQMPINKQMNKQGNKQKLAF